MAAVLSESVLDQNGPKDHFGQNDLIPNWILAFVRPKWTKMVHFGPFGLKGSILVRQPYSGHSFNSGPGDFDRTWDHKTRTEIDRPSVRGKPRSYSGPSLLRSCIAIPPSWYRAQKHLKPGNTKKKTRKSRNSPPTKSHEIPHPGSGPENTKKIQKK